MELLMSSEIAVFKPFPFEPGQKITISDGPRKGDWLVVDCDERKVILRCPVSHMEFSWNRFCYHVETKRQEWPARD